MNIKKKTPPFCGVGTALVTPFRDGEIDLLFLYFFYMLGSHVERSMGTLKFNLFYLSGVVLMDVFAMIFCPVIPEGMLTNAQYNYLIAVLPVYVDMAYFLHLSLIHTRRGEKIDQLIDHPFIYF